ncbi:hypothetical protein HYPSUDRAFT_204654 [Hypholoma sublateritium FD-334 SS-4]|uniref:Uncharacterized protein n=1 Tax=Hypholoma sublateritium (strain FD-334 SS-4) TaxID=945553 RepID=A0A0D2NKM6_HYPSF|nr:hypothetical protein HYPSUDRAFT_204654 [Hypholoma sublateritium FD-334 SS-4]
MHFAICHSDYIAYHASAHTRAILKLRRTKSNSAIDMSLDTLVTAAVAQREYTRTVAIVAQQITSYLRWEDALLAHRFTERLEDAVTKAFFTYWREYLRCDAPGYIPTHAANAVDPVALCAFVGDLFSARMISFGLFDDCVRALLAFTPSEFLLECLYGIFAHGRAYRHAALTPAYLLGCIGSIEQKCAAYRGPEILFFKENRLTALIYEIGFRAEGSFVADVVDWNLNLDTALTTASVCSTVNGWPSDACAPKRSPGARTLPFSTSIWSYTKAEQRNMEANANTTRPNKHSAATATPIKRADSTSSEESLVMHMPRAIAREKWEQFFRDHAQA